MDQIESGQLVVRDENRKEHTVNCAQLDCGYRFEVAPGDWRFESDPVVTRKIREILVQLKAHGGCDGVNPDSLEATVAALSRILIRQIPG